MATLTTSFPITRRPTLAARIAFWIVSSESFFLCGVTLLAFLLLGYHPYAEDGGIYAAAAALKLDPSLFPAERAFAVGQTGRSLFVPLVAMTARGLHVPLPVALLLLYVVALAATLTTALVLARCLFEQRIAQRWAVLTLAVSLGMPVAGTSLYLWDPYLTARSFSTPLLLLATAAMLRRRFATVAVWLALAFAVHPMMAAWAAVLFVVLWAQGSFRPLRWTVGVGAGLVALMAVVQLVAPGESGAARAAALSRNYWFLAGWQWYEIVGLVAPLGLMSAFARRGGRATIQPEYRDLALATTAAVMATACVSVLFVHEGSRSLLLARVQPLRMLHPAYLLMFMLLGGWLAEGRWRRVAWLPVVAAAVGLVLMQSQTYPSGKYFELPGRRSDNAWVQAFEWAGAHTPVDAVFALDAHYTSGRGEDAQLFRAVALRSQLPDAAKDGGISSVMTELAAEWQVAATAQAGLNGASDAERIARVRPLGATRIVLPAGAVTAFDCPYRNDGAKVCWLP